MHDWKIEKEAIISIVLKIELMIELEKLSVHSSLVEPTVEL